MDKKAMSKYPVGATWECEHKGKIWNIWLKERSPAFEIWMFSERYLDGSGYRSDWTTSYQSARNCCLFSGRMKRVKDKPN